MALAPFLGLNIISRFPETWDPAAGRTDQTDYRGMRTYLYPLRYCTVSSRATEVVTSRHREFFGIEDGQFHASPDGETNTVPINDLGELQYPTMASRPFGKAALEAFLVSESVPDHLPSDWDVSEVRMILCRMGLPVEIALQVLEDAEYFPKRRLRVPHDPFHPENKVELERYLEYCWALLVRCEMAATEMESGVPWRALVGECIVNLLFTHASEAYTVQDGDLEPEYIFK